MAFMSPTTGYPMSWGGTGQFQPQAYSGDVLGQIGQPFGGQLGWLVGQIGRILASGGVQQYGGQSFGTGQQPFGTGQQPFGVGQQPFGIGQQPFGIGQQPFGIGQQLFGGQQQYQPQDLSNVVGPIAAAIAPVISALIARAQAGGMQGYGMQGYGMQGLQGSQQFQPQGQIPQFGGQIHPQVAAVLQLLGAAVTQAQQAQQTQQQQGQGMQVPGQRQFVGV
jgi:hypothetical protein